MGEVEDMRGYMQIGRKTILILFFLFLILLSSSMPRLAGPLRDPENRKSGRNFHPFHQYIEMQYDPSILNQTLDIHKAINLPIKITYWTDMRENLLQWLPWMMRNYLIFNKSFPQQYIQLELTDKPDWANVGILQPEIPVDIPRVDTSEEITFPPRKVFSFISSIIISPLEEAPSRSYSIGIRVRCPEIGLLGESIFEKKITFRPKFLPRIQIKPDKTVKIALPHEAVNFNITVTNYANKKMRIQPDIGDLPEEWRPTINPSFMDINAGNNGSFYFSVFAPYDLGWHDSTETFKVNFTATSFPIDNNSITGGPYQVTLTVNNYGFSLPGFEYLNVLSAMLILLVIKKYMEEGR